MAKILFEIKYDIKPEFREEYLATIKELRTHLVNGSSKNYIVVENKQKPNNFTEIYICENEEEYENLEDEADSVAIEITTRIASKYISGGKTKYSTFYEVE